MGIAQLLLRHELCYVQSINILNTSCAHNMQKAHMALRVLRVAAHHMYVHVKCSKLTFLTHKL